MNKQNSVNKLYFVENNLNKIIIILILLTIIVTGCQRKTPESSWPSEPNKLVEHLNSWHKDELDVYENPQKYPNRIASGETGGWVEAHRKILKEKHTKIKWDTENQKYIIVK
jgi:hypothetical protein